MDVAMLAERAQAGDPDAFAELVRRYAAMVNGYALATTGDPDLADDATQQAFITAWRNLGSLRHPERFGGWLRGIARFECLHLLRQRRPERDLARRGRFRARAGTIARRHRRQQRRRERDRRRDQPTPRSRADRHHPRLGPRAVAAGYRRVPRPACLDRQQPDAQCQGAPAPERNCRHANHSNTRSRSACRPDRRGRPRRKEPRSMPACSERPPILRRVSIAGATADAS